MKNSIFSLILMSTLLLFAGCNPQQLRYDMAKFDKAFVSMFYAVYQQDAFEAQSNVFLLEREWQQFNQKYKGVEHFSEEWTLSFNSIDHWLGEAYRAVDAHFWEEAYTKLDHVRYEFMQFRECHDVPYYLDHLWNFQMSFEMVQNIANDPMLCLMEWQEFVGLVHEMEDHWKTVYNNEPELKIFTLDVVEEHLFNQYKSEISKNIIELGKIIDCADRAFIALTCEKIETPTYQMIRVFGNTGANKTYFAEKK